MERISFPVNGSLKIDLRALRPRKIWTFSFCVASFWRPRSSGMASLMSSFLSSSISWSFSGEAAEKWVLLFSVISLMSP